MVDIEMEDEVDQPESTLESQIKENMIINEQYKQWKKNAPFLYDFFYARALEWPTLTTQWFPDKKEVPGVPNEQLHRMLMGTTTAKSEENEDPQNFVIISSIELPDKWAKAPEPADFNAETGEIGGHGAARKKFDYQVVQRMNHPGDVNKARYMPQNPDVIATMSGDGNSYVFNRTRHESFPKNRQDQFDIKLVGHDAEGYGLSWSFHKEGQLATGTEDKTVRLWDIERDYQKWNKTISPTYTFRHHSATVNDVAHHPLHGHWLGSVSDDLTVKILDMRQQNVTRVAFEAEAHKDAVNCLAFHPQWEEIVATGSADKGVALWDLRNMKDAINRFEGHKDAVIKLEWSPHEPAILASGSYDRRIIFWDLSRIGEEQTAEFAQEGPPELLYMHGGFTQRVSDFSFNKHLRWVVLGAAEDNQIQVFQPSRDLVKYIQAGKSKDGQVNNDEIQE